MARRKKDASPEDAPDARRLGYLASFKALAAVRGVVPLLLIGFLRTAVFMGYLSYLAAFYEERFDLDAGLFAFVWTLSGASFFVSNLLTGRVTNSAAPRVATERMLGIGLAAALVSVVGFYFTHWLPLALAMTALHAASHAIVAACRGSASSCGACAPRCAARRCVSTRRARASACSSARTRRRGPRPRRLPRHRRRLRRPGRRRARRDGPGAARVPR